MPVYPITLSDAHDTMLQWAAQVRNMTVEEAIGDALIEFLRPLEARYMQAHKAQLTTLFSQLTVEQQTSILATMRQMQEGA